MSGKSQRVSLAERKKGARTYALSFLWSVKSSYFSMTALLSLSPKTEERAPSENIKDGPALLNLSQARVHSQGTTQTWGHHFSNSRIQLDTVELGTTMSVG